MTKDHAAPFDVEAEFKRQLEHHLSLGPDKCLSYLPVWSRPEGRMVLDLPVETYVELAERRGYKVFRYQKEECRIADGAVFACHQLEFESLIAANLDLFKSLGWEVSFKAVIDKIAAEHFDYDHPIMLFIGKAFGDDFTLARIKEAQMPFNGLS